MKTNSENLIRRNILRLLLERQISKHELALSIDMDDSNFGKMINGSRAFDYSKLDSIALFFNVEVYELFLYDKLIQYTQNHTTIIAIKTSKTINQDILQQIANLL